MLAILFVLVSMVITAALSATLLVGGSKYAKKISAGINTAQDEPSTDNNGEQNENSRKDEENSLSNILKVCIAI